MKICSTSLVALLYIFLVYTGIAPVEVPAEKQTN